MFDLKTLEDVYAEAWRPLQHARQVLRTSSDAEICKAEAALSVITKYEFFNLANTLAGSSTIVHWSEMSMDDVDELDDITIAEKTHLTAGGFKDALELLEYTSQQSELVGGLYILQNHSEFIKLSCKMISEELKDTTAIEFLPTVSKDFLEEVMNFLPRTSLPSQETRNILSVYCELEDRSPSESMLRLLTKSATLLNCDRKQLKAIADDAGTESPAKRL